MYPLFFIILVWVITMKPHIFLNKFPTFLSNNTNKVSFKNMIPIYPQTLLKSWEVSRLEFELTILETQNPKNQTKINELINQIGNILDNPKITIDQIHSIHKNLIEVNNQISISQRVTGFFTFVNFVWLIAIIGITISVGPCIYVILEPLRTAMVKISIFIYDYIIINFHIWGIWEIIFYMISFFLILEGLRFDQEVGFYVSLSGLFLSIPSYCYSYALNCPFKFNDNMMIFSILWINASVFPLSVYYNSSFLAWIFVISIFNCIGFSVICYGLCYVIGFSNQYNLYRCAIASIILQILFIGMKIFGVNVDIISLYQTPFVTFGSVVLHLALLIVSFKYYEDKKTYVLRQFLMVILLIFSLFIGSVWNLNGLFNTACTFAVLYLMEKYVEIHVESNWNGWILIFMISIFTYYSALYLHRNPKFIISLFEYN